MDIQANNNTKACPFCAEQIPAAAIKCRHCGEIFTPERLKLVEKVLSGNDESAPESEQDLLVISPSLWSVVSSTKKTLLVLFASLILLIIPLEKPFKPAPPTSSSSLQNNTVVNQNQSGTSSFYSSFRKFRIVISLLIILITASFLAQKAYQLTKISYRITPKRIEYSRGLFSKKIDNIDMFRIVDMKMRQTTFDRITGTGTVIIYTTDKTDPEFHIEKVKNPGLLYDIIKKYSLDADKSGAVIHIE